MRRVWLAPLALAAACGRSGFDPVTGSDLGADAALPRLVCAATRTPIDPATTDAATDLAIDATSAGFTALWTYRGGALHGATLDPELHLTGGPQRIDPGPFDGVAGVADLGWLLAAVTIDNDRQTLWTLDPDLTSPVERLTEKAIAGRDPIATGGGVHALLRATGQKLVMTYIKSDGSLGNNEIFTTSRSITAVSSDDGPGHGHLVWREVEGGLSRCTIADVLYDSPLTPTMSSFSQVLSDDCHEPRNANGPVAADSMFIVWRTSAREVRAKYAVYTGDIDTVVSKAGRAPRARFDGSSRFWVAWIEEQPRPTLQVAWIGLDGTLSSSELPGWTPAGDEAFELVHSGDSTYLAVLGEDSLDMLTLCP